MEMLGNLGVFIIGSAVIALIWLVYATLNNVVSKITNAQARELLGSVATILLFAAVGVVFAIADIKFWMGLILAVGIWFIVYMAKKMLTTVQS